MRTLAIGDIHGCYTALITLAQRVPFQPDDQLICLGDFIDRGPDSKRVVEWLIERDQQRTLQTLLGNHEEMMLTARISLPAFEFWLEVGGDATLVSYAPDGQPGRLEDIPPTHWDFIENRCRDWVETPTHFFVHANADPELPLDHQSEHMLRWQHIHRPWPHRSGKIMVCGHTAQRSGLPLSFGHTVCIDTWAHGQGWLTCLDVGTSRIWQATQRGEFRQGTLTAPP
jgi:serine/threonine protein phosphatase 1